ncbi:MAG: hypothetical protein SXV54_06705 [Chloroflexota bacterium]|nr:hypothetical protein [Chloroflexota bacterium]
MSILRWSGEEAQATEDGWSSDFLLPARDTSWGEMPTTIPPLAKGNWDVSDVTGPASHRPALLVFSLFSPGTDVAVGFCRSPAPAGVWTAGWTVAEAGLRGF